MQNDQTLFNVYSQTDNTEHKHTEPLDPQTPYLCLKGTNSTRNAFDTNAPTMRAGDTETTPNKHTV